MLILRIFQLIAVIGTILTGLLSLFWPKMAEGFTGLTAPGGRGITEIRAVLGGTFIGLGVYALMAGSRSAYQMLGATYLTIGVVRAVSMVADKSVDRSNFISLVVEIVFGIILVL